MSTHPKIQFEPGKKYRLITRSDMDGLVCAVILRELDLIDDILFAHPKDMQDGKIEVGFNDITTNLPYVPSVHLCFDHHASEAQRLGKQPSNHVIDPEAPSAARVVHNFFKGDPRLAVVSDELMTAVDKVDSAGFTREDILHPQGWELLSFIMDARTGLGRFKDFNISNYQLMMNLIDYVRDSKSVSDILAIPDVKERVDIYFAHKEKFQEQIQRCVRLEKNFIVLDLRREETQWAGNRFVIYAMFPQCNISTHIMWGRNKQNTVFAVGKSILNRTSKTDVGALMLEYGGGGHNAAGTCQIDNLKADTVLAELIARINKDG
jgi:nanoRNase/pAp phosphatase (c-di-AMP/oligoRNAs hydrolase)